MIEIDIKRRATVYILVVIGLILDMFEFKTSHAVYVMAILQHIEDYK